jgi:broad specificity phosphatase PhoE
MILIRHGQTLFNVLFPATRQDPGVHDPALTETGAAQARALADALGGDRITRIIASPYTRTLQTADALARARDLPVAIDVRVRERFAYACDVGTRASDLARTWPAFSFDALAEQWWPAAEEPHDSLDARCADFHRDLCAAPDYPRIAVVTHREVIRALTGRIIQPGEFVRMMDPHEFP